MKTPKWAAVLALAALIAGCESKESKSDSKSPEQASQALKAEGKDQDMAATGKAPSAAANPGDEDKSGTDSNKDIDSAKGEMAKPATGESGASMDKPATGEAPKSPPLIEYAKTPADKLGTLPSGIGIPVGQQAPDVTLTTVSGESTTLSSFYKQGPILLTFYRGGWCPYCNFQVRALSKANDQFKAQGITPVLVSVDKPSIGEATRLAHEAPFPILSDSSLTGLKAFKVLNPVDEATLSQYKGYGIDLEASSGEKHHTIAIPSMFLISQQGKVLFAHADPDYKVRPDIAPLLAKLGEALKAK